MSFLNEWHAVCDLARKAADDMLHLDSTTIVARSGSAAAAVQTRIDRKGDVDTFVDPAVADAAILEIHAEATAALVQLHEARVSLVSGIAGSLV
jgi:hypothetical protein